MKNYLKGTSVALVEFTFGLTIRNKWARLIKYQNYGKGADGFDDMIALLTGY